MSARPRRLLPLSEVMARVGLRRSTIYEWIGRGAFPPPVSLGATSRWVESEVEAWIDARIAERDSSTHTGAQMGAPATVGAEAVPARQSVTASMR